jgi:hypothetical protein
MRDFMIPSHRPSTDVPPGLRLAEGEDREAASAEGYGGQACGLDAEANGEGGCLGVWASQAR